MDFGDRIDGQMAPSCEFAPDRQRESPSPNPPLDVRCDRFFQPGAANAADAEIEKPVIDRAHFNNNSPVANVALTATKPGHAPHRKSNTIVEPCFRRGRRHRGRLRAAQSLELGDGIREIRGRRRVQA